MRNTINSERIDMLLTNLEGVKRKKEKAPDVGKWKLYRYHEKKLKEALNNLMDSSYYGVQVRK